MAPFAPFEAEPVLAVAVSGGRDSLALALLAHDWAVARKGRVLALIVDHGLRPESGAEARTTLERLGRHRHCRRDPGLGRDEARQRAAAGGARRALPAAPRRLPTPRHPAPAGGASCRRPGGDASPCARRAQSGPDGLAGMAAAVEHRDARLLRPLLGVPRDRLDGDARDAWHRLDRRSVERRPPLRARAGSPGRQRASRRRSRTRRPGRRAIALWPRRRWRPSMSSRMARSPWITLARVAHGRGNCSPSAEPGRPGRRPAAIIRRGATGWSGRRHGFRRGRSAASREKARISRYPAAS